MFGKEIVAEIQRIEANKLEIRKMILNNEKDINLILAVHIDENSKEYLMNIFFQIEKEIFSKDITDSLLVKEELRLFSLNHIKSRFFDTKSQKLKDGKTLQLLKVKLPNSNKDIYLNRAEANAIVSLWMMALSGYSYSYICSDKYSYDYKKWKETLIEKKIIIE